MIFIFEKDDVYAERKLHCFETSTSFTLKTELDKNEKHRFYLFNDFANERAYEPEKSMKRGKMAAFLTQRGFCPIEQRHIANSAAKYLESVAKAAIASYRSIPKYVWRPTMDQLTARDRHSMLPPATYNCRCVPTPIIIEPKSGSETVPRGTDAQKSEEKENVLAKEVITRKHAPEGATHWYDGSIRVRACWVRINTESKPVGCDYWCQGHWLPVRFHSLMTTRIKPIGDLPSGE